MEPLSHCDVRSRLWFVTQCSRRKPPFWPDIRHRQAIPTLLVELPSTTENAPVQSSKTLENARGMVLEILMIMNKPVYVYKLETSVFGVNTESKRLRDLNYGNSKLQLLLHTYGLRVTWRNNVMNRCSKYVKNKITISTFECLFFHTTIIINQNQAIENHHVID